MNILVIDDEPVIGRGFDAALRGSGHSVRAITTPRALEDAFQGQRYDVAFVDFVLPALDGDAVTRWILLNHPAVIVVAMSGLCDGETAERMKRNGAREFLPKPFSRAELLAVLGRLTPPDGGTP
jgi:CheY-like chemotaxis protein